MISLLLPFLTMSNVYCIHIHAHIFLDTVAETFFLYLLNLINSWYAEMKRVISKVQSCTGVYLNWKSLSRATSSSIIGKSSG